MTQRHQPPSRSWIGYPPTLQEAATQSVLVSGEGPGVTLIMFLPTEEGHGRQYNLHLTTPQELWDFLHQLPRETPQTLLAWFGWQAPAPSQRHRTLSISLEDLDL